MVLQEVRDGQAVLAVLRHPERQRFKALQEEPRRVGSQRRPLVAEADRAQTHDEGQRIRVAEIMGETQAVVAAVGQIVEVEFRIGPVEIARVDDGAADGRAMAADPLGKRMDDDVRAIFDGAQQRRRRERRIDDQRQMVFFGDRRISFDISDIQARVADRLDVDGARLVVDGGLHGDEIVDGREIHLDALLRQNRVELRIGASVQVVCGDDFVALLRDVRDGEVDGRRAGRDGQRRRAAFDRRQTLLQNVLRRIHQAGVDVAAFAKREQIGPVL